METVDRNLQNEPVRIGIGPKEHHEVLTKALGCEEVYTVEQLDLYMANELPKPLRRDEDTAVLIRPTYLSPAHIKWLAASKALFEVPGHEPRRLVSWNDRQEFRSLKPDAENIQVPESRGAEKTYDIPDEYHATAVKLWHHGKMQDGRWRATYKPTEIVTKIKEDTGVEVSKTWARDRAIEAVGHAARNPNAKEGQR